MDQWGSEAGPAGQHIGLQPLIWGLAKHYQFHCDRFLPQCGENVFVCYSAQQLSCAILLLPVLFREKPQNWFAINEVITVIIFLYLYYLYFLQCSS